MSLYDADAVTVYDGEREWVHPDLDLPYIDGVAADAASILQTAAAEIAYQPGDGSRYALVLTPLFLLQATRPRMKDGQAWERHAVSGMVGMDALDREAKDGSGYYGEGGYLLSHVEGASYPVRLNGRSRPLAASYVAEHWGLSGTSACSVAILLRAIAYYLDKWDDMDTARTANERREQIRKENA